LDDAPGTVCRANFQLLLLGRTGRVARRTMLGDDGNQIGAHSTLLAASKQGEDGRTPQLNGYFPEFSLGWTN
jgi:hypothetical protein